MFALAAQALPGTAWAGDDPGFVTGLADVPLMPGLAEVPEAGMIFDKPSGRIVEAVAQGTVTKDEVTTFYATTLPNLGWRAKAESLFKRDGEVRLGISDADGATLVRFTVQPE